MEAAQHDDFITAHGGPKNLSRETSLVALAEGTPNDSMELMALRTAGKPWR